MIPLTLTAKSDRNGPVTNAGGIIKITQSKRFLRDKDMVFIIS
tara:strand:+ start:51 stop:179 length:129 start_codon:yes stop_codon:yes gene_type:complete